MGLGFKDFLEQSALLPIILLQSYWELRDGLCMARDLRAMDY